MELGLFVVCCQLYVKYVFNLKLLELDRESPAALVRKHALMFSLCIVETALKLWICDYHESCQLAQVRFKTTLNTFPLSDKQGDTHTRDSPSVDTVAFRIRIEPFRG